MKNVLWPLARKKLKIKTKEKKEKVLLSQNFPNVPSDIIKSENQHEDGSLD